MFEIIAPMQHPPPITQAPVYQQSPSGQIVPPGSLPVQSQYPQPPVGQVIAPGPVPVQGQFPAQPGQIIVAPSFGRDPTTMTCPHCKQQIQTTTKTSVGAIGKF